MADEKQKMTSSYKAVFVFSIVMIFVSLISSTATHTHPAASVVWGMLSWNIYKQNNAELVGACKALLWLGGIAFAILLLFLLLDTNAAIYGFSYTTLILIAVMMAIYSGMLQFFKQQLVNPSVTNANNDDFLNAEQDADLSSYIQAMSEIRNNNKEEGLWIKCFADNDGDVARTEAAYIKYRVNKINANSISNKNVNDVKNEYADTPAFDLIEKKLYTIKEHNKKPYWLLKNNNAAIQANQIIYVYSNETDCKNAINSGELNLGVKLAIKANSNYEVAHCDLKDVNEEHYHLYPSSFFIRNKLYELKNYKDRKYMLLKNGNAAITLGNNIYVYITENDFKNSIAKGYGGAKQIIDVKTLL